MIIPLFVQLELNLAEGNVEWCRLCAQNSNEISPKAYPEEMEVIRTLSANTSFGTPLPLNPHSLGCPSSSKLNLAILHYFLQPGRWVKACRCSPSWACVDD